MTDKLERLRELLLRYSTKTNSAAEEVEMYTLLNNSSANEVEPVLNNILENTEPKYDDHRRERILASVLQYAKEEESGERLVVSMKPRIQLWKRIAIAASIVGVLFVSYWLMSDKTTVDGPQTTVIQSNDVQAPDRNRAQIKLADGTVVYLDSAANGQLALQGNVKLVMNANGEIVYETKDDGPLTTIQYNTLYNPRGSKVQPLTLSDGTKVWLNNESSIKYPTAFAGDERKVEISGEAYFEVAHNPAKPFIVTKGEMNVTVLGTHFNVNTYNDENDIKVTLLEGSVRVQPVADPSTGSGPKSVVIKPGEQARVVNSELSIVNNADLEQVMAWKNGYFQLSGSNLQAIMRQIERWYDVEVVYEGIISQRRFGGQLPRTASLLEVLKILEESDMHFMVEGRKVVVQ